MEYQMICTENNRVIMRDPRVFTRFDDVEYALAKRMCVDSEPWNWGIEIV